MILFSNVWADESTLPLTPFMEKEPSSYKTAKPGASQIVGFQKW